MLARFMLCFVYGLFRSLCCIWRWFLYNLMVMPQQPSANYSSVYDVSTRKCCTCVHTTCSIFSLFYRSHATLAHYSYPHRHSSFSPPLLIISYTAGTLHFVASILSLQGWQAGHKLSWRWGWKLEEIVMKISSVCRNGRSCSCHQPRAGGITPGQHMCVCVWMCSLDICIGTWIQEQCAHT